MTVSDPGQTREQSADAGRDEARYQIGEVADRTGVTKRTLRFYEEKELLRPADRMEGGFRLYSERDIDRIELIKQLQGLLGLSLANIKEMVDAEELLQQMRATFRPDRDLPTRRQRVSQVLTAIRLQREIIDHKIEQLSEMKQRIDERFEAVSRAAREIDDALARQVSPQQQQ